jgi:integrase
MTNTYRVKAVLDVEIEGRKLRDWPYAELRRRHATALVDHMLRVQGRAMVGAKGVLSTLSAMTEDAITDEVALTNAFKGLRLRPNDPRIQKDSRPIRVWSWEQMHAFARACGETGIEHRATYAEPMVRVLSDCGLRIGELLALRRQDLNVADALLEVRQSADQWGSILAGTKEDRLKQRDPGKRLGRDVPVPPDLLAMLVRMPKRIDSQFLFPQARGGVWQYKSWREFVWGRGVEVLGVDPRPHEFRHSMISLLLAAGIDSADLAAITGHTVMTMHGRYSHALGRSFDDVRKAVGE